jgi:hypothetical protein
MKHVLTRLFALMLALVAAACGGSDNATTAASTTTGPITELFEGTLQGAGDSTFFSFTVNATGNVNVTLASVTTATTPGTSINLALGLGLGSPVATECSVTNQTTTTPSLVTQLFSANLAPAVYCVRVFDVGTVTRPINFAVRIVHT